MVVMVHNTDVPDGWEREGEDPQYFFTFSPDCLRRRDRHSAVSMTH